MKSEEEKYRKKTSSYVFSWFWNFTSLGGLTQVRDTDTSCSKAYWFILAIIGWVLTAFSTFNTIESFLAHDTITKTTFKNGTVFQDNLVFPSVSICNSNRIHCGHLYNLIRKCEKVCKYIQIYTNLYIYILLNQRSNLTIFIIITLNKNATNCERTPDDVKTIYCGLFIRAQCPISLIEADRFTYGESYTREIVCDPNIKESCKLAILLP